MTEPVRSIDGTKFWYMDGDLHRTDGPAVECIDGYKSWWLNGKRHCEDGPAVEYADGTKEYWYGGKQIDEEHFLSDEFKIQITMDE